MPFVIESLTAFLAIDPNGGDEGIIGIRTPEGDWMPLVAADAARIESLRPHAEDLARQHKIRIVLARFERRVEVGEIIEHFKNPVAKPGEPPES